jgi:hypothetical protein
MKHGAVMPHIVRTRLQLRARDIALEPMETETKSFHGIANERNRCTMIAAFELKKEIVVRDSRRST